MAVDERDLRAAHRAGLGLPQLKRALDDRGPRIPRGGAVGQVVTKTSSADDLVAWALAAEVAAAVILF